MKYVAFLRGINVGGRTKVDMAALRATCEKLGFENVRTYINSGNVIFEARKSSTEKFARLLEQAVETDIGLKTSIMVRTMDQVIDLLNLNPFGGKQTENQELFIVFLAEKLSKEKIDHLLGKNSEGETFEVVDDNVFCLMNKGFQDSVLGKKFIDNKLKVPATARNIRTVQKLSAM